jgi:hypothetical protein
LSVSRPGHFIPGEGVQGTHWIGGWVGPGVGLDVVADIKDKYFGLLFQSRMIIITVVSPYRGNYFSYEYLLGSFDTVFIMTGYRHFYIIFTPHR